MKPIRTERLILRNWQERDRDLFHRINSDDQVMEFFGMRRSRAESDELFDRLATGVERDGFGFAAAEIAASGECIGFVGLLRTDLEPFIAKGMLEIGWRLAPEFWGKGYVTEAADAWLAYAFEVIGEDEVVSFAVWNNNRSTAVMRRLGMQAVPSRDFDHPRVPDTHPALRRHVFYRLSQAEWQQKKAAN
ncbi:RimJ/RimL family protein N-acetyltransferase [Aminobacter lissarensis]|uniref:RimJ/RimL family protein N-acetyltransferase n=1 Tax=Aminobacter carboxidus TaxID=376165 RepID=A0A8E1WA76_9HYPH|nr:GNAT family N-acetyltransferase [Aminobacter lissarensis]MBB6464597.1 RimJ/RimL family protein N-acetyltransferase [Aminobacter lissarensis]